MYILTSEGLLFPNDGRSVVLLRKGSKPGTPIFAIPKYVTDSEFWVDDIDGSNTDYFDLLKIKHPMETLDENRRIRLMYDTLKKKGIKIYPSIRGYDDFFNITLVSGHVNDMTSWILKNLVPGNYTLEGTEEFQHIVFEDEII